MSGVDNTPIGPPGGDVTAEWLNDNGFINMDPAEAKQLVLDPRFGDPPPPIYPAFARERWHGLSDKDWNGILPGIRLASRIIDDPQVFPFFVGLIRDGTWQVNGAGRSATAAGSNLAFHMVQPNGPEERDTYWRLLRQADPKMFFEFHDSIYDDVEDSPGQLYAATRPPQPLPWNNSITACHIVFCPEFLGFMTGIYRVEDVARDWQPGANQESAMLRCYTFFAVTLCHEYCHAMWFTRLSPLPFGTRFFNPLAEANYSTSSNEPFYRNHRLAELGWAFESKILGGAFDPITWLDDTPDEGSRSQEVECRDGLVQKKWPGTASKHELYPQVASAQKWGTKWQTDYPVPMDWIRKLFTDRFWDREFAMYGLEALKPPRRYGFRIWDEAGLGSGESPDGIWTKLPGTPESEVSVAVNDDVYYGITDRGEGMFRRGDRMDGRPAP